MKKTTMAFGTVPKDGGTFTFYKNIRPILMKHGIDMRCVSIGKLQSDLWDDKYSDEGCVLLAPSSRSIKKQTKAFVAWCAKENVSVVMGINSEAILSSIPHLPSHIKVLSRCANAFDHGYKITLSGYDRLSKIIALTPRLQRDLIEIYGADPNKITLIPNGINPTKYGQAACAVRGSQPELRLGFLGRLENNQKGVFHLPKIVQVLNRRGVKFSLQIAGKGKHRSVIEKEMQDEVRNGQVVFEGALVPDYIPEFLGTIDAFIFTSHFEGCPNALLEAMMAGCVPVSWLIEGITDFIIDDRESGFIHKIGDYNSMANSIELLAFNRSLLREMSLNAGKIARTRFSNEIAGKLYADVIMLSLESNLPVWKPKPWDEFVPDPNFSHSWTEWLPSGLSAMLKRLRRH